VKAITSLLCFLDFIFKCFSAVIFAASRFGTVGIWRRPVHMHIYSWFLRCFFDSVVMALTVVTNPLVEILVFLAAMMPLVPMVVAVAMMIDDRLHLRVRLAAR
jgi:hypothetical protein